MSDDGFDSMPTAADAPDACQYAGCQDPPRYWVHFRAEPDEYLTYCQEHTLDRRDMTDAKSSGVLR